ncbi:DUF2911 domain-containing protein [Rhodohalobacter halophilus]|uniref:DUF2911 domain-containing protein n=1 Tax=Rhodohalobacter halophilus TaxID=1812810 RepID=UPI000A027D13|nr:DUF2911 domain-containing protein [Rhodohalobacter halophilus]
MKTVWIVLFVFIFAGCSSNSDQTDTPAETDTSTELEMSDQETESDRENESGEEEGEEVLSPQREASGDIGGSQIVIEYSAPSVRERIIWDDLVPYGEIWVSGAHMATSVEFEDDMLVNGEPVPAGKYAFFTIPGEETWTVIMNEHWDQHQAGEYDEELDVARFDVEPMLNEHTEQLVYSVVSEDDDSGFIELAWEEIRIRVPVRAAP